MRLLSVGPLPPTPSGVADYTAGLLPHLARYVDLAVAVPDDAPAPAVRVPVLRFSELTSRTRASFDLPIYHLGNHRFHAEPLRLLGEWPGLVVLHDAVLHHLYADVLLSRGRTIAYLREAAFDSGRPALEEALRAVRGEAPPAWYERPMLARALATARGALLHSRVALAAARRASPHLPIRLTHLAVDPPPSDPPAPTSEGFLVGTFGALTEEKRIRSVVAAFAELRRGHPRARLVLAGESASNLPLEQLVAEHGVADAARITGRIPLDEMDALISASDVVVQLRWPTAGEASAATLRALRLGRPTVVANCGWFADLPDEAAARIPAGLPEAQESAALAAALRRLADDPAERARLSDGARAYARACDWDGAARAYVDFARELVGAGDPAPAGHVLSR